MPDYKPFKHGEEGTHYACPEMLEKLGDKVGCCGCNKHNCKDMPDKTFEEAIDVIIGGICGCTARKAEPNRIRKDHDDTKDRIKQLFRELFMKSIGEKETGGRPMIIPLGHKDNPKVKVDYQEIRNTVRDEATARFEELIKK